MAKPRSLPTQSADDPLLTREQIAELLGVSARSIDRYVAAREIVQPLRIGKQGCLRWRKSTFERWLEKQEKAAQDAAR